MARILVADDDENLPDLIGTLLEKEGHSVILARSGTEAIQYLVSHSFDLIIVDWDMPGVDGVRVCRGYRQRGGLAYIIMLTGRNDMASKEAGFNAGADDYMTKPFKAKELLVRVSAFLRRQAITNSHSQQSAAQWSTPPGQQQAIPAPQHNSRPPGHHPESNAHQQQCLGNTPGSEDKQFNQQQSQWPPRQVGGYGAADSHGAPASAPSGPHQVQVPPNAQPVQHPSPANVQQGGPGIAGASHDSESGHKGLWRDLTGQVLVDRYEVLERLGQGGMGLVYKARQTSLQRLVAIKVMSKELVNDATALQRFQCEARILSMVEHPNLVLVHDFGKTAYDEPFMVMEFLEGKTLDDILEKERLSVDRLLDVFIQLCEGMQAAHEKGVIHRDLKPANVMLVEKFGRETVKILDLGLAKFVDEQQGLKLTRKGEVFGSPLYMCPEQCMSKPMDHRADIYSMGCMLYECVAGKPPLVGHNFMSTSLKHVTETAPRLSELIPGIPAELDNLVVQCLQKQVADRPASMMVIHEQLRHLRLTLGHRRG